MKNILQRDNQKRDKKIQHKHIPHCSLKQDSEKRVGRGWTPEGKKWIYIFKAKERKQYQNNSTENLFIVIMYLIEAFKMRLLSIDSRKFWITKKKQFDFQMTGQVFKRWTDAWDVDEEGSSSIFKIEAAQEKMLIIFNLQTAVT